MAQSRKGQTRTTTQRGYGAEHQRIKKQWAPSVEQGRVTCWRCGQLIHVGEKWDLGHDDHDRTVYRGPEHAGRCNRAAAARKVNAMRRARRHGAGQVTGRPNPSRDW